jgi:hypothetical protein
MDHHLTQGAFLTSRSIHRQSPMLLVCLYFSYFKIRLVNFKNKISLIGNLHRRHISSSVTFISLTDRWNITSRQALSEVIYLTGNLPWSLSGRDRDDADMDPFARCMVFSDDVHSNGKVLCCCKNDMLK